MVDIKSPIYVRKPEDAPKTKHWAIFEQSSYTENDSYDRNGGYSTHNYVSYTAYTNKDEWLAEIERRVNFTKNQFSSYKSFSIAEITPCTININVSVGVK